MKMTLRETIEWIALNDEPEDLEVDNVAGYISTLLASDIYDRPAVDMAYRIVTFRRTGTHVAGWGKITDYNPH